MGSVSDRTGLSAALLASLDLGLESRANHKVATPNNRAVDDEYVECCNRQPCQKGDGKKSKAGEQRRLVERHHFPEVEDERDDHANQTDCHVEGEIAANKREKK